MTYVYSSPKTAGQKIGLFAGPSAFVLIYALQGVIPLDAKATHVLAVAAWMLVWWVTEAVGLAVPALLPLILFPYLGIKALKDVSGAYSHPFIFLFMGGFAIALAMEKHGLHRRIALQIVKYTMQWVSLSSRGLILGFMLATAFLSMWISNTATTVMMLPIAMSVIGLLHDQKPDPKFATAILLAVAYSANIGGIATLVGTPPNSQFASIMEDQYGIKVGFAKWMMVGLPFAALMLAVTYFFLVYIFFRSDATYSSSSQNIIHDELEKLGKPSTSEWIVLSIFILTAVSWIAKDTANFFFELQLTDAGIAMTSMLLLFVLPSGIHQGTRILEWDDTRRLAWGILLLFGGGLALARGLSDTGIISMIGDQVTQAGMTQVILVMLVLTAIMLFMTELMSNIALTTVFVPIVAVVAAGMGENYLTFTIPVTIAASCAFMLPMSTPPNAIVFSSGHIKVAQMARVGFFLNLIAISLTATVGYALVGWVFGE